MRNYLFTCFALFLIQQTYCGVRIKRQVSFNFPILGRPTNSPNHGGNQPGSTQSLGSVANSFLGGFFGNQGSNHNQGIPFINFNNQDPCHNNGGCEHICEVIGRRRRCLCDQGFALNDDFRTCSDIDECSLALDNPCQDRCKNTIGSYECSCGGQAILLPDKRSCVTSTQPTGPPSCSVNNGGCEHKCNERRGKVRCRCNRGYTLDQDGQKCSDVDECATGQNSCPATCVNTAGSYSCGDGGGGEPESCDVNNGGCQHRCRKNKKGVIRCTCKRNFELNSNGKTCDSVGGPSGSQNNGGEKETCEVNNGGCEQRCRENRKGVRCGCRKKFALKEDGKTCERVSSASTDPCQSATCDQNCRVVRARAECFCDNGFHLQDGQCIEDKPIQPPQGGPPIVHPPPVKPPPVEPPPVKPPPIEPPPVVPPPVEPPPVKPPPVLPPPVKPPPLNKIPHLPVVTKVDDCGINPNKSLYNRIVGGKPAHPEDWPWIVAILQKGATNNFCAASLISELYALTAAHCLTSFTSGEILVRIGEYNFDQGNERSAQDYEVAKIILHEKYDLVTNENDIAILKLTKPVVPGKHAHAVCLPLPTGDYAGKAGIVTGWGTIYFGGPVSDVLQEVVLPVWTETDCKGAYKDKILPGMMCAGLKEGGKDACQGDSGGPFVMQDPYTAQFFQAGIVSWGIECASPNRPGVYTVVRDYMDWIAAHTI